MKITIIGGGNMGGAIARGLLSREVVPAANLTIADPSQAVHDAFGLFDPEVKCLSDNRAATENADLVVLAVKPWLMQQVCEQLVGAIDPSRQMVASIAAGITFAQITEWLDVSPAIFRVIPNTAIALGESMTFIASERASDGQRRTVAALFEPLGKVMMVEESQVVAVTALASCGIAYALRYMDASARGGRQLGIPYAESQRIVMQTVQGALALLQANGTAPQTEIDKVTTPGGITLKGLEEMERCGFSEATIKGLMASK
jgi:pyrroline-5-carboxylate reductase